MGMEDFTTKTARVVLLMVVERTERSMAWEPFIMRVETSPTTANGKMKNLMEEVLSLMTHLQTLLEASTA